MLSINADAFTYGRGQSGSLFALSAKGWLQLLRQNIGTKRERLGLGVGDRAASRYYVDHPLFDTGAVMTIGNNLKFGKSVAAE